MKKLSLILAILIITISVGCAVPGAAFAETVTIYTTALEDLQRDKTFDYSKYKDEFDTRYTVVFIALAESSDNELFVYLACDEDNVATSINISTTIDDNLRYTNYSLSLLNRYDFGDNDLNCFDRYWHIDKYLVNGFKLQAEFERYYDISAVYREWNAAFDFESPDRNNTISEKAFEVGRRITIINTDIGVDYSEKHTEVVTVTDKHCGYLRYLSGGFLLYGADSCDSHYIAFSCDYDIDALYEADVSFHYKQYYLPAGFSPDSQLAMLRDEGDLTTYITDKQIVVNPGSGLFHQDKLWHRIEKVSDFITNENLNEKEKASVENKQWVLRFYESEFFQSAASMAGKAYRWTEVSDETILRLKFLMDGEIYNLGVVDNKQSEPSGGQSPGNQTSPGEDILTWWENFVNSWDSFWAKVANAWNNYKWIFITVIALAVLGVLALIFKPLWIVFKFLFKGLWFIISLPIRLIVNLIAKISGKDDGSKGG